MIFSYAANGNENSGKKTERSERGGKSDGVFFSEQAGGRDVFRRIEIRGIGIGSASGSRYGDEIFRLQTGQDRLAGNRLLKGRPSEHIRPLRARTLGIRSDADRGNAEIWMRADDRCQEGEIRRFIVPIGDEEYMSGFVRIESGKGRLQGSSDIGASFFKPVRIDGSDASVELIRIICRDAGRFRLSGKRQDRYGRVRKMPDNVPGDPFCGIDAGNALWKIFRKHAFRGIHNDHDLFIRIESDGGRPEGIDGRGRDESDAENKQNPLQKRTLSGYGIVRAFGRNRAGSP